MTPLPEDHSAWPPWVREILQRPTSYQLCGRTPEPRPGLLEESVDRLRAIEGDLRSARRRRVAETVLVTPRGIARVSTVFLMFDHAYFGGPPILFETMNFGPEEPDQVDFRSRTWREAEALHALVVRWVSGLPVPTSGGVVCWPEVPDLGSGNDDSVPASGALPNAGNK